MKNNYSKPTQFIDSIGGQSLDNLEDSIFSNLLDNLHKDRTTEIVMNLRRFMAN